MSAFLRQYLTVVIFGGAAVVMVGSMLGMARLVRPTRPQTGKYINYECGVDPVGVGWSQSQIRYYVFALLFVMFDVEAVFIFPWAVRLEQLAVFGLVEMGVFVLILALGLLYDWSFTSGSGREGDVLQAPPQEAHLAAELQPEVLAVGVPVGAGVLRHRDG